MSRRAWFVVSLALVVVLGAAIVVARQDGGPDREADDRVALVRRSWTSIVGWLETHAPTSAAALRDPVPEVVLSWGQKTTGREWPEQLVAWLRMNDGGGRPSDAEVLPLGFPLGASGIVENWQVNVDVTDDLTGEIWEPAEVAGAEGQPAGSNAAPFLRSWLPVASNGSGDHLFVDLRPGPRSGLVAEFEHDNGGFTRPALWPDIAAMLEDVASALRNGRWVHPNLPDYDLVPVVENGRLRWESGPSSEKKLSEPPPRPKTREDLRAHVALLDGTWSDEDIMARLGISAAELADVRAENERFMQEQRRASEQRQREEQQRWLKEHRPGEQQDRPGG